jgi:AraC-like DNA-binding protein
MRQLYIHFRAKILSGLDIFNFIEMNYEINFKDFPLIPSLADNLRPENNRQKPSLIETDGTLRLFISYFSRVNEKKDSNLPDFIKFMPALDYMEKNYNHRITLETLATTMNLQPTYFSNLFKKSFKVPPMTFLNRKRIEKAQGILLSESGNVTEAAEASGFSDVFYFSKTFRKITGVSPSEYKKYRKTIIL